MSTVKEKLREIIRDELGRHQSKFIGNCNIVCAIRILNELPSLRDDFKATIALATFIHKSWKDIELSDEQVELIIAKAYQLAVDEQTCK